MTRASADVQAWPRGVASHLGLTGGVLTTAQATGLGVSPGQLRRLVASGQLSRVGTGVYVESSRLRTQFPQQAHAARAKALVSTRPDLALSHHSAAAVLNLPWVGALPEEVHLTRIGSGQHRRTRHATVHPAYPKAQFVQVEGVRAVEVALVLLGVAERHAVEEVVVVGDAALHRGLVSVERIRSVIASCRHRPGVGLLAAAVPKLEARSESPGESLARLGMCTLGYDVEPQVKIKLPDGSFARVDFLLREYGVVVEFDGRVKYEGDGRRSGAQALMEEKVREDQLRSLGYVVVRLTWRDVRDPERLRRILADAVRAATSSGRVAVR